MNSSRATGTRALCEIARRGSVAILEMINALQKELQANPTTQVVVASEEFLERGEFDFEGTIVPKRRDDGLWEIIFIEGGHEVGEWV